MSYKVSRRQGGYLYLNTRLGVGAEGNGGVKSYSVLGLNLWEDSGIITERGEGIRKNMSSVLSTFVSPTQIPS